MAKVPNAVEIVPKNLNRLSRAQCARTLQTTDGRATADSERERSLKTDLSKVVCVSSNAVMAISRSQSLLRPRERLRSIAMSMSVCESVCLSARISPEPRARSLPNLMHVGYVRGSVLLQYVYDRPHRLSPGRVFFPLKMHYRLEKGLHTADEVCYLRLPCYHSEA